ncbi:WYL domain-containing protein [Acinetobacter bereziniae]|uniref:helix-turn-helix transcriptional regulator n=1 Tax=Acinetobacter bereziniae TaxID=106648 RepID=UPI000EF6457E|nr:WYL domain-containing protein [Acinetobacter bereziniae]MBJ8423086.1 WYL domain-containing protein [Acinetobacter bereziniae]MCU4473989.1 WYL domain-containing protein [Acinetobacter bereziniae]MCU4540519.1 WYL domain-containing protein [Acinetobacter bereziniae]MCU4624506.1 WYL domain-containing protein [Acinetobacter bereziniae]
METGPTHERLAERIVKIIVKLNSGKKLSVRELAQEFKTHPRTIQRDFERLEIASLPIVRDEETKRIYLNPVFMGNYGIQDIVHFAQLSGVQDLYPKLNIPFLRGLLNQQKPQTYAAKGYTFEDTTLFTEHFKQLNEAVEQRRQIQFLYKDSIRHVQPYKVIHHHGSWYLAATEQGELKTYRLSRIRHISCHQNLIFEQNPDVLHRLDNEDTIWFGLEKTEVILTVHTDVAMYFLQRELLPEQHVIKQLEDGSLLISSQVTHHQQILPLVRYWIPNVKILNPNGLQDELEGELRRYLDFT